MTMISLHGKRLAKKKRRSVIDHLAGLGFTNRLALYIIAFLAAGLIGGIDRRLLSCQREYSNRLYRRANVLDGGFYPNRDRGQSCAGENRDKEHDRKLRS